MLRYQLLALIAVSAHAAVIPPAIQEYPRLSEPRVWQFQGGENIWNEYGLIEAEQAEFKGSRRPFTVTAWRMKDATGAMAAFQWQRPESGTPIATLRHAVRLPDGVMAAVGNYLLKIEGYRPPPSELVVFFQDFEGFVNSQLPLLPTYLPEKRDASKDRYITGIQSLRAFLPGWTAESAGFDSEAELQVGEVDGAKLILARYPTQHIAKAKLGEFSRLPGAALHRSGPIVALLLPQNGLPVPEGLASSVLSPIEFKTNLVENEANPLHFTRDTANMMLSIFALAGILLAICFGAGLIVGGIRIMGGRKDMGESIQTLHLSDR